MRTNVGKKWETEHYRREKKKDRNKKRIKKEKKDSKPTKLLLHIAKSILCLSFSGYFSIPIFDI